MKPHTSQVWPAAVALQRFIVAAMAAVIAMTGGCAPAVAQTPENAPAPQAAIHPATPRVAMTPLQEADPATLEVSGTGQVTVPSDRARVSFAVETEGKTAGDAARANADAMDAAISALRGSGVDGLIVETHGYGLHPQYSDRTQANVAPRIISYRAVNTVTVTTTDVASVGGLIDTATEAGVNRVASLAFDATDTEAARQEALAEAVRRARGEAEAIAGALGVPLGAVLRVQGGSQGVGPRPPIAYRAMEMAASTPVEAAGQTVTASVTITYALGPS